MTTCKFLCLLLPLLPSLTTPLTSASPPTVLVTGGLGYIGSHTTVELLNSNRRVVILDDLSNSSPIALSRIKKLCPNVKDDMLVFRQGDVRDKTCVTNVLEDYPAITSCIHFAGLKAVGESVSLPLLYYNTNVAGTVNLLECLEKAKVRNFVFSSSATVYGEPEELPIGEGAELRATNPYGRTKLFIEEILRDCHCGSPSSWNVLILRYFNPIGAHSSGQIGEDPRGIPNNLMPFVAQVAVGRREKLSVFGNDYPTKDGTGVRDYIHVVDLARGHVAAVDKLEGGEVGCQAVNLGTGKGVSVLELVESMSEASGRKIPYVFADRRPGDVASCYCDPRKAENLLGGWRAELGIEEMCRDTWKWQSSNPEGYTEELVEID